eukprot:CAMPEP_0113663576 /NCGR_PEP_ID=MMETSP0038_2-20120614/1229_1 /TAXON_ID=2898 /ORGANISM="Cryptomonas paramecium" /LENGTH=127 /DNA_ID=CAMNT_0000578639 /DNA_START=174 /DNA_END=557 /DNA_ORIENTATION=- /assembly_acc=CAM_ASM_000170
MGHNVEAGNEESFNAALQDSQMPAVVDFFATWCGPCTVLAPHLEEVAKEYKGKIRFLKIDSDQNEDLAIAQEIAALPSLLFIKQGKILQKIEGSMNAENIRATCNYLFFGGDLPEDARLKKLLRAKS